MSKVKYYYDSETLSYKKIERKKGRRLGIALLSVLGAFLAGFILLVIYLNIPQLETPKGKSPDKGAGEYETAIRLAQPKNGPGAAGSGKC